MIERFCVNSPEAVRSTAPIFALMAACLAMGAIAMTITSASVALSSVQADLDLGMTELQWVMNSFIVSYAVFLLPFGRWSDRVGRRPLLLLGAVVFVLATFVSASASSYAMLIGARIVQGIGGALVTAAAPAALTSAFVNEDERKRAFGYLGASGGIGLTLGALLGGVVANWYGWRAAFALPLPVMVAAFGFAAATREKLTQHLSARIATTGSLFRNRQFVLASVVCLLFTTAWVALFIYAPLHMQAADGRSAQDAAFTMLALMLPALVMPVIASKLVLRMHIGSVLIAGFMAMSAGLCLMQAGWSGHPGSWLEVCGLVLAGAGAGTLYGLVDYLALTAVHTAAAGAASGAFNVVRLGGDVLAALIPGAVILHTLRHTLAPFAGWDIPAPILNKLAAGSAQALGEMNLPPAVFDTVSIHAEAGFKSGMNNALWVLLALCLAGALVSLAIRQIPLHSSSSGAGQAV